MGLTVSSSSNQAQPTNSDIGLGWVVGLIEGEGWIGLSSHGLPRVQVATTDEDVARRLAEWTGVGHVTGPLPGSIKPVYKWTVTRREDAGRLLERLLPLLCTRRAAKARDVIAHWRSLPPKRGTAPTCGKGHLLDVANMRLVDGRRRCLKCQAARQRAHRERARAS